MDVVCVIKLEIVLLNLDTFRSIAPVPREAKTALPVPIQERPLLDH